MQPLLNVEISQLGIAERIQLAEDLWDSILSSPEALPITDNQKQELNSRLAAYDQDPTAGASWQDVKKRLEYNL
ncbi:MAG: addiction module protein [Cyanobacteria bacterium J06627_3]